ncbi:MAG: ATP-binding cassette domain-containing protein, partial [Verrucomicrobia bacterium]|nr:ATP-binding cassette domain-containing protein [Verrucomicrobiota bacterium]
QLERNLVRATIDRFKIRTPSVDQPVAFLSGGNQQKVVIGRWVISDPKLYVFDEPTQGVDVATKLELYRVIRDLAGRGAAIILLSSDLLELIGLSDRILVVSRGVIVDSVPSVDATEERIVGSAVSQKAGFGVPDTPRSRRMLGSRAPLLRRYGNVLLLLVLMLSVAFYTCSKSKYFLTERNLGSLLLQLVPLAFASIGQMMVILLGGIDLSVGPVISLTTALASYFLLPGLEPFGIFLCMLAGLIIGGTNAILILALKIPDLISTLSTYSIVFGLALLVRPSPGGHVSEAFSDLITARLGWVPTITLVVIMLVLLGEWLLVKSRVGIHFYAAGARPEAAYLCGIPVTHLRFVSYLFSGLMAAVAGLVVAARIGSGDPQSGSQFTLSSVAAVVVGGTSIFGGRGTLIGTFLAAIFLVLLQDALNQIHVTAYYQYIWTGLLLLIAVAFKD